MTYIPNTTYRVVRLYADDRPAETLVRGLTLAQAQAHCQRDDTSGDGWFDGYYAETTSETTGEDVDPRYDRGEGVCPDWEDPVAWREDREG